MVINNGDPESGDTSSGKTVKNIWAFQLAEDRVMDGAYEFHIRKLDRQGQPVNISQNTFYVAKLENGSEHRISPLNISGNTSKVDEGPIISYLKDNDVNLLIRYVNDNQIFALESLEYGVPCLIHENSCLKGSKLEEMLRVNNPNDIYEIKNKILEVVDNKDKIIEEYKEFKKNYNKEVEELKNNFLK